MPPMLTPPAIARTLEELDLFTQRNAATLAARNGTDVLTSLRQLHSSEEQRFYQFLRRHASCFTDDHRRQLADAFAHVMQARAAEAVPTVPAAPCADSAARERPQTSQEPAASLSCAAAPSSPPAACLYRARCGETSGAETPAHHSRTDRILLWRRSFRHRAARRCAGGAPPRS